MITRKALLYVTVAASSLLLSPLSIYAIGSIGEFQSGVVAAFGLTVAALACQLALDEISSERRYRGYLKGIYLEIRLALRPLKTFPKSPMSLATVDFLETMCWEQFKSTDFVDPTNELHSKIAHIYEGLHLISSYSKRAVELAASSPRAEWSELSAGLMKVTRSVVRWVVPLLEEASLELAEDLNINQKEMEAMELRTQQRIEQLRNSTEADSLTDTSAPAQ